MGEHLPHVHGKHEKKTSGLKTTTLIEIWNKNSRDILIHPKTKTAHQKWMFGRRSFSFCRPQLLN